MKHNMKWNIWWKKVVLSVVAVVVAGGLVVWQDSMYWLALLPLLKGIENYLKHS